MIFVGCTHNDIDVSQSSVSQIITFSTSVEATRATQIKQIGTDEQISIAAFLEDADNTPYYSELLSYSGSGWSSGVNRYWSAEYNMSFFAYSPLRDFIVVENDDNYDSYSLRYTSPSSIYDQLDLVVVSVENESYSGSALELGFSHALSSIGFNIYFTDEVNVRLDAIQIYYIGIEKEREYNFASGKWIEPEDEDKLYFNNENTAIEFEYNEGITYGTSYTDIEQLLMIIPQEISDGKTDPHRVAIRIDYTLVGAQDESYTTVYSGVASLPAPTDDEGNDTSFEMNHKYTYNISIGTDEISFGQVEIEDQEDPVAAYGNVDLGLITEMITYNEYWASLTNSVNEYDEGEAHTYYSTALRVAQLMEDDVRDFVVVGSFGANDEGSHDGKLGYYGGESSPFVIAANSLGMMPNYYIDDSGNMEFTSDPLSEYLISVDLRGVYDFPTFYSAHGDVASDGVMLDGDAPILTAGTFRDVALLDEVVLPSGLAAIDKYAFQNCISLTKVDLAEVIHVEEGGFVDCVNLIEVVGSSLTRIHANAFDDCVALETIDLTNVTQIDEFGFVDCARLSNVNLANLTSVGEHAFSGCSSLTLEVGSLSPEFTYVADYAFSGCSVLDSYINLDKATYVGDHAFNECNEIKLNSVYLEYLATIGDYAFTDCLYIGYYNGDMSLPEINTIGVSAFEGCTSLNIKEGLSRLNVINTSTFQGCTSFTGYASDTDGGVLSLPLVTSVGDYGFNNTAITNVDFSSDDPQLTAIGAHAFDSCASLVTISGLDCVTSVGNYAFSGCTALEELSLASLTTCGCAFFAECTSLTYLSMPNVTDNNVSWWDADNEKYIESTISTMVQSCPLLETVVLSSLEGSFGGWGAYSSYASIVTDEEDWSVTLSDPIVQYIRIVDLNSITELIGGTFYYNESVEVLDLSSVTTMGSSALQYCTKLRKLNLSSLVDYKNGDLWAFAGIPNDQCEIWLSSEQAENVSTDGVTWQGVTWKAIYTDTLSFTLE